MKSNFILLILWNFFAIALIFILNLSAGPTNNHIALNIFLIFYNFFYTFFPIILFSWVIFILNKFYLNGISIIFSYIYINWIYGGYEGLSTFGIPIVRHGEVTLSAYCFFFSLIVFSFQVANFPSIREKKKSD